MKNTLLLIQYVRKFLVEDEKVKLYVKDKVYQIGRASCRERV